MLKRPNKLLWISLALGWVFDLLFWGKPLGISFAVYVALTLGAGFLIARQEGFQPQRATLWLLLPIIFFTVMSVIRLEPMTTFLNRSLVLLLMMILASAFLGGRWPRYQLSDYAARLGAVFVSALSRAGIQFLSSSEGGKSDKHEAGAFRKAAPFLRGILLATPVILVFGALLSSADPVFSQIFESFLAIFRIDNLPEYIVRVTLIIVIASFLFGIYWHALLKSKVDELTSEKHPLKPFLGFIEAAIILGSVVALFGVFVFIQVQYLFGGLDNIKVDGFTFSEYARRGFYELAAVAFFSLLLFLVMSNVTRRKEGQQKKIFSGLGIALVALVGVILVSAFNRLALYEFAFGFTRLRTYSHVFMIWVGILLAATVILEVLGKPRMLIFAALMAALGFAASLDLLNVDAFIAQQNISRLNEFEQIKSGSTDRIRANRAVDIVYLASLSTDAVPAMSKLLAKAQANNDSVLIKVAEQAFACHAAQNNNYDNELPWQSFSFSGWRAYQAFQQVSEQVECLR